MARQGAALDRSANTLEDERPGGRERLRIGRGVDRRRGGARGGTRGRQRRPRPRAARRRAPGAARSARRNRLRTESGSSRCAATLRSRRRRAARARRREAAPAPATTASGGGSRRGRSGRAADRPRAVDHPDLLALVDERAARPSVSSSTAAARASPPPSASRRGRSRGWRCTHASRRRRLRRALERRGERPASQLAWRRSKAKTRVEVLEVGPERGRRAGRPRRSAAPRRPPRAARRARGRSRARRASGSGRAQLVGVDRQRERLARRAGRRAAPRP